MNTVVWKENALAMIIAWIVAMSIFVVLDNMAFFQANIIASPQDQLEAADIILEAQGSSFTLQSQRVFTNLTSASILIFTNPQTITIKKESINTSVPWSLIDQENGSYLLMFNDITELNLNETLVSFVIEWPYDDITIWDIVLWFADGSIQVLSLGTKIIEE
jgi:hypothetical protein